SRRQSRRNRFSGVPRSCCIVRPAYCWRRVTTRHATISPITVPTIGPVAIAISMWMFSGRSNGISARYTSPLMRANSANSPSPRRHPLPTPVATALPGSGLFDIVHRHRERVRVKEHEGAAPEAPHDLARVDEQRFADALLVQRVV